MTTTKSAKRIPARPECTTSRSAQNRWSLPDENGTAALQDAADIFTAGADNFGDKALDWPCDETSRRETVLVVDDEPLMLQFLADILRYSGYEVLEASGAREAQQVTQTNAHINLLLTDFSMPGINGLELARWFQSKYPGTKVLIATGALWELANQIGDRERMAILPKPFDVGQLSRMVRLALA